MVARVLQLSDPHLYADAGVLKREVPTQETFAEVLALAMRRFPDPDAIVLTGDIAHDEAPETYRVLRELLGEHVDRCYPIPGNHDHREGLRDAFPQRFTATGPLRFEVAVGGWRIIGLDSHVPEEVWGELGAEQLAWLGETLDADSSPTVIFVHHPPVPLGSTWMDAIGLRDAAAFADAVTRYRHVAAVCHGHAHQEFEGTMGSALVYGAPSTAFQFTVGTPEFGIDPLAPGFRVLELGDALRSSVIRTATVRYPAATD